MEKERLYLDTSVPSAHLDPRWPSRQALTQRFWKEVLPEFDVYVSTTTLQELTEAPDTEHRGQLLALVSSFKILKASPEVTQLAEAFLEEGLISENKPEDARHLAVAIVRGIDILVSWNFEDMVNIGTKRLLPMLCAKHGYFKQLLIASPQELFRRKPRT